jgi:TP901 family phage tail tape measure protein
MAVPAPQVLDTLYVLIQADASDYLKTIDQVIAKTRQAAGVLSSLGGSSPATSGFKQMSEAITGANLALTNMTANLEKFKKSLAGVAGGAMRDYKEIADKARFINKDYNETLKQGAKDTDGFSGKVRVAGRLIGEVGKTITGVWSGVAKAFKDARYEMLLMGGAIKALEALSLREFEKFDKELMKVLIGTRDFAGAGRGPITKDILQMARGSTQTPEDLVKSLGILTRSGMNAFQAMQALNIADKFATASFMDMTNATQRLVDVQLALGLSSQNANVHMKNMEQLANTFVAMAPRMNTTVEELIDSFGGRFAAAVREYNISLSDAIALQGAYAASGIKAAEASNRAAQFILLLGKVNVEQRFFWDQIVGKNAVFDAQGKLLPMADVINSISKAFAGLNDQAKVAKMQLLGFQPRQIQALLPLLGRGDDMKRFAEEAKNAQKILDQAAEAFRKSFSGQMLVFWNNVKALGITIGQILAPSVMWLNDQLKKLTDWFASLDPKFQKIIIAEVSAAGGAMLLGYAFTSLFNVGTLVVGIMGLLGVNIFELGVKAGWFGKEWKDAFETFSRSVGDALLVVKEMFTDVWKYIVDIGKASFHYLAGYIEAEMVAVATKIQMTKIGWSLEKGFYVTPITPQEDRRIEAHKRREWARLGKWFEAEVGVAGEELGEKMGKVMPGVKKAMEPLGEAFGKAGKGGRLALSLEQFWDKGRLKVPVAKRGAAEEAGDLAGKTGPGFEFKQIALARYMLGGPMAAKLDYEQLDVLRQIKGGIDNLVILGRGGQAQGAAVPFKNLPPAVRNIIPIMGLFG